jgi:hypothetical protein
MVGKSNIGSAVKKKRGPKPGMKEGPRKGRSVAALNMKKGRKSEKSPAAALGTQKFF